MRNTEFVMVPRECAETMASGDLLKQPVSDAREQLRSILAKPADQHQGDPVALPEGIEYVQEALSDQYAKGWNDSLEAVAKLGPLYTHADPGEVERLRDELEQFKIANARLSMSNVDRRNQNVELRAQLAERDALLRDTLKFMDATNSCYPMPYELRERMRTALEFGK